MPALPPRAVIAEDEVLLAEAFAVDLSRAWPELQIVAVAHDGQTALNAIQQHQPDVAFLDIRMPGMSGLDVAQALIEDWPEQGMQNALPVMQDDGWYGQGFGSSSEHPPPLLVFVTPYDAPAVEAFELAAVDYPLTPVEPARLQTCVVRLKQRLNERAHPGDPMQRLVQQLRPLLQTNQTTQRPAQHLRNITAGVGNQVKVVPMGQVLYLQSTDKYVSVVHQEGDLLLRSSLSALEPRLDERFVRIHRGCIVNMDYVTAAVRDEQGRVRARLRGRPESLPVSRLYTHHFRPL